MTISYINDHFLRSWKKMNTNLGTLDVNDNHVIYQDTDLNMGDFNVQELMYDSSLFSAEVGSMDAQKLFEILKTNVIAHEISKKEDELDDIIIQSLSLAKEQGKDGITRTFAVYTDQNNTRHMIKGISPSIVLQAYQSLAISGKEVSVQKLKEKLTPKPAKQQQEGKKDVVIPRISWKAYYKMIHEPNALEDDQEQDLREFNDFLLGLNTYEEYLTKDNSDALHQYRYTMLELQSKKDTQRANDNETRAIGSYYEMMDKITFHHAQEQELTTSKGQELKLEKKAQTGKISIAVILLLLSNVVIHVMFLLLLK